MTWLNRFLKMQFSLPIYTLIYDQVKGSCVHGAGNGVFKKKSLFQEIQCYTTFEDSRKGLP